jgi:hypothetical protein
MGLDSNMGTTRQVMKYLSTSALLEFLVILYVLIVGIEYIQDPLAKSPQLDARENLTLASQIASGDLAQEPMYRAMLYPWLISHIPGKGAWPQVAVVLGILFHLVSAFQVRYLSRQIWQSDSAAKIAFCLSCLNPVSLFYAMQVMDISLAIVLFLSALILLFSNKRPIATTLMAGMLAGTACLTRPHFLPVAILLFIVPVILHWPAKSDSMKRAVPLMAGLALVLGFQGLINYKLAGEYRILPWQGSYNLWAANRPGSNGLYYKQLVDVSGRSFTNPARAESEILYAGETGERPPLSIDKMNKHWRDKALNSFMEEPVRWVTHGLFKGYAVINSYEQYNNLTFSFHKNRLLFLRFNPVSWGILLMLGLGGLYLLFLDRTKLAMTFCLLAGGYAVSLIIYYASARFRLPLVPLLTILASGFMAQSVVLFKHRSHRWALTAIILLTASITFSSLGGIRSRDTYVQDRLLLANAYADTGRDLQAAAYARRVLEEHPERTEALRIYTISYFNLELIQAEGAGSFGSWEEQRQWIRQDSPTDPVQDAILGVYYWNWGETERAVTIWKSIGPGEGWNLAQACLAATDPSRTLATELIPMRQALARLLIQKDGI